MTLPPRAGGRYRRTIAGAEEYQTPNRPQHAPLPPVDSAPPMPSKARFPISQRRPKSAPARLGLFGTVVTLGLAGACNDMSSIDRRVERVVGDRSRSLGSDASPPRHDFISPDDTGGREGRARSLEKHPPSNNPDAADLGFTPGDVSPEAVLKRLDSYYANEPDAIPIDLEGAFRASVSSGREYKNAEEDYILVAIRLLAEQHLWGPRFFDDLSAKAAGLGVNGSYQSALVVINELRATQRLPYGGEVEAQLISSATRQLAGEVSELYVQSNQVVLSGNVPLLRGAGPIAQESLIQAERNLVYAARDWEDFRRRHLVDIARDYFALVAFQLNIKSQERRLEGVMQLQTRTDALVEAGRMSAFQGRNVLQNVLTSRSSLETAREQYILALDRFKIRLGIDMAKPIRIEPVTLELPEPEISVSAAAALALKYRLPYQNARDRDDDARRAVENAKNGLLPDLNINGSTSFNTNKGSHVGKFTFDSGDTDFTAGVTFSLPLDREIERLHVREATIQLQKQLRDTSLLRDELILEARQAVRQLDVSRNALTLLEKAIEINELRLEELRIKEGEVNPQDQLDAENELLQSRTDYQNALRDLRIAILDYLISTGQLRVTPDGLFKPLQGMVVKMNATDYPVPPPPLPIPQQEQPMPPPPPPGTPVPEGFPPPSTPPAAEPEAKPASDPAAQPAQSPPPHNHP